ncbi:MAG TPA: SUMF1/EgtB/PvdO family nonheme iron enzyme [Bacteroidia bacterium]|nr:SUMF1/EgtB/PvdO family nonheme iron enzyme [Bacteroidia bacterium]
MTRLLSLMKLPPLLFASLLILLLPSCRSGAGSSKAIYNKSIDEPFLKAVDEYFVKVTDSLYAMTTEVANGQYREFLLSLVAQGRDEEFKQYNVDSTQWRKKLSYGEPLILFYHSHPAYKNYPALSMSYEGAVAFCEWLTTEYKKKGTKKFKSVKFRLPTGEEWKLAANGRTDKRAFPWGFNGLKDTQGKWLANFRHVDEAKLRDTMIERKRYLIDESKFPDFDYHHINHIAEVMRPVKTYPPNSIGIYDMAGNVSEMLSVKGRTKGGNWNSLGYYLRIDAPDEFGGQMIEPSPLVGFRVFAEIVEN